MTRAQLPLCQKCTQRQARGYLSVHTSTGKHAACWASCYHCADLDAPDLDRDGFLVSFIAPPTHESVRP
jgi:hypothetical protein